MFATSVFLSFFFCSAFAATADQWRGRSIYQLVTDRFALPPGANTSACDPGQQTWCGGVWDTITQNLDYIQDAGFTAIWISPVVQNYDGPRTVYGDAYHGYWPADVSQLNPKFGTSDDLKALSAELHRRDMYLMVDMVLNNVMSTSVNVTQNSADLSTYFFKEPSQYHPYCAVDWSNLTSEQNCWLGDTNVPLPDVNTQDSSVISAYGDWIQSFVQEYSIDGLRIDAAKHVDADFWPDFSAKAGVFCIGEVMEQDVATPAMYQGPLDAVLHYPMYYALTEAFGIPGPGNISAVTDIMSQSKAQFKDTTLLGNFLENQDVPRWHNLSVDPQSLYNAMVFNFMSDGIPIVYYGQEQGFSGNADPWNREPLWTSGYAKTPAYQLMATLNEFRNFLVNKTDWATQKAQPLSTTSNGISLLKGNVVSIMTNIGSPNQPQNTSVPVYTPWPASTATMDILTCTQWVAGSNGTIEVQYTKGGTPVILIRSEDLAGSGICGFATNPSGLVATNAGFDLQRPSTLLFVLSVFILWALGSCL